MTVKEKLRSKDVGFVSLTKIKEEFYNFFKFDSIIKTVKPLVVGGAIFMSVNSACFGQMNEIIGYKCDNGKWGFKNRVTGKILIKCKWDNVFGFYSNEGVGIIINNGKYGIVNESGKEIIRPKYDVISRFVDGLAKVKISDKYGFINAQGVEVIRPKYDWIGDGFWEDLAKVRLDDKFGFINSKGYEIVKPKYDLLQILD